jgi:hypothetical protein
MVGRIVIHAGDCKTGSTALQAALAQGRVTVDGQVPAYPALLNHNALAQGLIHPARRADAEPRLVALLHRLQASTAPLGVISAEHFEFVDPAVLAALLDRALGPAAADVQVLTYVRPHGPRALSSFAEMVKLGEWLGDLDGFLARALTRGSFHYAPRFARWRAAFGDRFTLRLYQRDALAGGDLVLDAARAMAPGADVRVTPGVAENESLSLPALAALQGLHRRLPPALHGRAWRKPVAALGRAMAATLGPALPGDRPALSGAQARRMVTAWTADAAALDAGFFAGQGAPLTQALLALPDQASNPAPDQAQSLDPADHLPPDGLRQLDLWADVFGRLIQADPAQFAWAARDPAWRPTRAPGSVTGPDADEEAPDAA